MYYQESSNWPILITILANTMHNVFHKNATKYSYNIPTLSVAGIKIPTVQCRL